MFPVALMDADHSNSLRPREATQRRASGCLLALPWRRGRKGAFCYRGPQASLQSQLKFRSKQRLFKEARMTWGNAMRSLIRSLISILMLAFLPSLALAAERPDSAYPPAPAA